MMGRGAFALLLASSALGGAELPTAWSADAPDQVQVLDGALLSIRGQRIRLAQVAAPAPAQRCDAGRAFVTCGQAAVEVMRSLVATGSVRCRILGLKPLPWAAQAPVWLGVCESQGIDLGRALVQAGFGVPAAGSAYADDGLSACVGRQGLWAWSLESPWTFARRREGDSIQPIFIGVRSGTPCLQAIAAPREAYGH